MPAQRAIPVIRGAAVLRGHRVMVGVMEPPVRALQLTPEAVAAGTATKYIRVFALLLALFLLRLPLPVVVAVGLRAFPLLRVGITAHVGEMETTHQSLQIREREGHEVMDRQQ